LYLQTLRACHFSVYGLWLLRFASSNSTCLSLFGLRPWLLLLYIQTLRVYPSSV
jgi:hypothetical protein